jgi:integrase
MMRRTRKQRGTVELRNGTWTARVRQERIDPSTGAISRPRLRITLGTDAELRTQAAATRALVAWLARNQPEQLQVGAAVLFAIYCEHYIEIVVALFRASARARYRSMIRHHLIPAFGLLPLARVDTAAIKAFLARMATAGKRRSTVMGARAILLQILRQARAEGFDAQTIEPRLVRLPKDDTAEREPRHIADDELQQILTSSEMPWRALYAVLGLLGLRIAEGLGLAWHHLVDLDGAAPLALIRQSTALGHLLPLKTRTSRADLPLPPELVVILRAYRTVWRPNPAGLLFATRSGSPQRADNLRARQLHPLLDRLGIPRAGWHSFRHGAPRRLFARGVSAETVRRLMRHASLQQTQRYSHATAEDLRAAVTASAQRLQPPASVTLADPTRRAGAGN